MADPAKGAKSDAMRIDADLVRELAQMLTDNQLTEIEVEDGDRRIKVIRTPAAVIGAPMAAPAGGAPALSAPPMRGHEDVGAVSLAAQPPEAAGNSVKSPMVGTVFLSSEPSAAPFVAVGDTVKAGDTLLIIEAMKVMNPITAPESGVVKDILVANAQPVEFDQPLVILG